MEYNHSIGKVFFVREIRMGTASNFFPGSYVIIVRYLSIGFIAALCCLGNLHAADCLNPKEQETYQQTEEGPVKMTFAEWVGLEKEEKNPEYELPIGKPWLSHLPRTLLLCSASEPELTIVSAGGLKNRPLYLLFHNLKIHLA